MQKDYIANINLGYWKSPKTKAQRSHIFNSLREACFLSAPVGRENIFHRSRRRRPVAENEGEGEELRAKLLKEGKTHFILNSSDKATSNNGFDNIKELLLQYHNYAMYEAYEAMKSRNVRVYSVKSHAFTVHPHDLRLIKGHETRHHRNVVSYFDLRS